MYHYFAYGLFIESELAFPGLQAMQEPPPSGERVVVIKIATVSPDGLCLPINKGLFYQANERELWLHVPPIGHFLITGGHLITVSPKDKIDENSLRECILNNCIAVILQQRGLFILQGCTIKADNCCFAIIGNSGVGKSTIAAAFFKRGYSILTDDFSPINALSYVLPGVPSIKLWQQAAEQLELKNKLAGKVRPKIQKWILPLGKQYHPQPLPLSVIYIIEDQNQDKYSWRPITGINKMIYLQELSYRRDYLSGLNSEKNRLIRATQIAKQSPMTKIIRPHEEFNLEECLTFIEKDLNQHELFYG